MLSSQALNAILANNSTIGISSVNEQIGLVTGGETSNITAGEVTIDSLSGNINLGSYGNMYLSSISGSIFTYTESLSGIITLGTQTAGINIGGQVQNFNSGISILANNCINLHAGPENPEMIPEMIIGNSYVVNNTMPILNISGTNFTTSSNITFANILGGLITTNTTGGGVTLIISDSIVSDPNWATTLASFSGTLRVGSTFPFIVSCSGSSNTLVTTANNVHNYIGTSTIIPGVTRMFHLQYISDSYYNLY